MVGNCRQQNAIANINKIVYFTRWSEGNKFDIGDVKTSAWSFGVLPSDIEVASIIAVNNTIYVAGGLVNGQLYNQ